jgi:hypothetical protein
MAGKFIQMFSVSARDGKSGAAQIFRQIFFQRHRRRLDSCLVICKAFLRLETVVALVPSEPETKCWSHN